MTADLAAYTTLVEPPAGLDPHAHTRVHLHGLVLDLPPAGTPLAPRIELRPMPATPPPSPHPGPVQTPAGAGSALSVAGRAPGAPDAGPVPAGPVRSRSAPPAGR